MYRRFHCFAERRIGWGERWKNHKSHVDNRRYRFLYAIHRSFDIHLPELTAVHCYGSRKYFYDVSWSFRDNIWKYARTTILMDRRSKIWNHFFFFTVISISWYFFMEFIIFINSKNSTPNFKFTRNIYFWNLEILFHAAHYPLDSKLDKKFVPPNLHCASWLRIKRYTYTHPFLI